MFSLEKYLEEAPRPLLHKIHRRCQQSVGLIKNSQVIMEVIAWGLGRERIIAALENLSPIQARILQWIYLSGNQGIDMRQIVGALPEDERSGIGPALKTLQWELFCRHGRTEKFESYTGFKELETIVQEWMEKRLPTLPPQEKHWFDYGGLLRVHLLAFCASAIKQRVQINQKGVLHRRFLNSFPTRLEYGLGVSENYPEDETAWLLCLASELKLIAQDQGVLVKGEFFQEFLLSPARLQIEILVDHWQKKLHRFGDNLLERVLSFFQQPRKASDLQKIFWVLEDQPSSVYPQSPCAWFEIPTPIRNLWMLGFLQISGKKDALNTIQISPIGEHWMKYKCLSESLFDTFPITMTPDFEVYMSVGSSGKFLFLMELLATALNDDSLTRYKLQREEFISGLHSGMAQAYLPAFLNELSKTSPSSIDTIKEWEKSVTNGSFSRPLLLKVNDAQKMTELEKMHGLSEYVREIIPGYGFIVEESKEASFRNLLKHLGLEPPPDYPEVKESQALPSARVIGSLTHGAAVVYDLEEPDQFSNSSLAYEGTKYSNHFQKLEFNQVLQVIRYATLMDLNLEVKLKKSQILLRSVFLNSHSDPLRLCGENLRESETVEIRVEDILEIRISE